MWWIVAAIVLVALLMGRSWILWVLWLGLIAGAIWGIKKTAEEKEYENVFWIVLAVIIVTIIFFGLML